MNKSLIFIFALLCVSVSANSMLEKYAFAFKSRRSIMQVMAQIESTIKAGGPLDAITNILASFEQEIKDEQASHQELHDKQNVECDDELQFRRHEISDASEAVHAAANTLESCQSQQARAITDKKQAENQLSNARTSLGQLNRQKIEWDYSYETFTHASQLALEAFPECYRLLDELDGGVQGSFLQITNHVTKMVPHVSNVRAMNKMNGVLAALAQVSTAGQADKVAIEKVRSVLIAFEADVRAKIEERGHENDTFQSYFTASESKYKAEVARLVTLIDDLTTEIHQLGNCISVQQGNLHSASEKLRRNTNLLNKAEAMCNSMREQFKKATEARRDELDLLHAIEIKVKERFSQLSHGAAQRGEMSAEQLGNYQQLSYDHQSFQG